MSDRVEQTYQLLRSYADWEPSLTTWTGSVVRAAGAHGEAAGIRQPCPHCQGTGRAGRGSCRFCKGAGDQWVDPQTERVVPAPSSNHHDFTVRDYETAVKHRRVRCDRCAGDGCPSCAQTGTVEIVDSRGTDRSLRRLQQDWPQLRQPGDPHEPPGWWLSQALDRKRAQWATGSYAELERLLATLERDHPVRFRLLDRHVIHPHDGVIVTDRVQVTVDLIVADLADGMPRHIVVPEQAMPKTDRVRQQWRLRSSAARHARDRRDRQLVAMIDEGFSVQHVARTFGLTDRRCRQILADHRPVATQVA